MPHQRNSRDPRVVAPLSDEAELLTIREAAKVVKVSDRTIRNWIDEGRLTAERFGPKIIRIERSQLRGLATPVNGEGAA